MAKRWHLVVEESFMVTGRGVVVLGTFHGVARQGEAATVLVQDAPFSVDHVYFDTPRGGKPGIVGIILRGVRKDQVPLGSVVESLD